MTGERPVVSLDLPAERSSPGAARAVLMQLARTCRSVRLEEAEIAELCVVLHEACTNVLEHSLGFDRERRVRVEFHRLDAGLRIVLEDDGPPYALPRREPPEPDELRERGYGLHIMRSWSDHLHLERDGRVNRLTIYRAYRVESGGRR